MNGCNLARGQLAMCNKRLNICISFDTVIPFLGFHLKHIMKDLCKYLAPRVIHCGTVERSVNPGAT